MLQMLLGQIARLEGERMKFKLNFDKKQLEKLQKALVKEGEFISSALAAQQVANVRKRAERGLDVQDRKMPLYSKGYANYRRKRGRRVDRRTLSFRGHMLRSIIAKRSSNTRQVIRFFDQRQLDKARYNQNIAKWFGVSPKDFEKLKRWLVRYLEKGV